MRAPTGLWNGVCAFQICGANTGVGKTVLSTLLARRFAKAQQWSGLETSNVRYIKPISTGPEKDSDAIYMNRYAPGVMTSTFVQYKQPVSPHLAAARSSRPSTISDTKIVNYVNSALARCARQSEEEGRRIFALVETAGGVLSPGPSGLPQAELFRPLRLPVILVADFRLGGISTTLSAAESLHVRGYDIDAVVCFDEGSRFENSQYFSRRGKGKLGINSFTLPQIPDLEGCSVETEHETMRRFYEGQDHNNDIYKLINWLFARDQRRRHALANMAEKTSKAIWHPFTQHKNIETTDDILVIDSAYEDNLQIKHTLKSLVLWDQRAGVPMLHPAFDGSASWWTQGIGHGNSRLSLAAAYAAGRYGHVMFAGATHMPALQLAHNLIRCLRNPRLSKVFYTDNGSTGTEVAIKMALRAACKRYDWDGSKEEVEILGLKGSYHGDTIGAMDASEPCIYNKKVDWYRGRGYWFDFPTVKMRKGKWFIEPPAGKEGDFGPTQQFDELHDVFDEARGSSPRYEEYIRKTLDRLVKTERRKFGGFIMEPLILGAGGMIFVDPLFQSTLVEVIRSYTFSESPPPSSTADSKDWRGVPIIFDEVFTGLHRLGPFSSSWFLPNYTHPDISVHAKLLTGGLLPLSATVASESIFSAFYGDDKSDALLHGHSYTAHPVGCHVANTALKIMADFKVNWKPYVEDWRTDLSNPTEALGTLRSRMTRSKSPGTHALPSEIRSWTSWMTGPLGSEEDLSDPNPVYPTQVPSPWSMWSKYTVIRLSHHSLVDSVIALGSVMAITMKDRDGAAGYTSDAAIGLRDALLNDVTSSEMSVHSRVLGNVIYFMAAINSKPTVLKTVERKILVRLNKLRRRDR